MSQPERIVGFLAREHPHGTRARYVNGCRCAPCRAANTALYHRRMARLRAAAPEVRPSGPALAGTLVRRGVTHRVRRCPGANGAACVAPGGPAWLKGAHAVCRSCVDRAAVWDGLVPARRARAHVRRLAREGVGQHAVADACDVSRTVIADIRTGRKTAIRRSTERRILAVDAGAIADSASVDAAGMNARLAALRARGFTLVQLGALLGYAPGVSLQLGARARAEAATVARVERLWRRVARGEVVPIRRWLEGPEVAAARAWLDGLIERGVTARWLTARLGFGVHRGDRGRMLAKNLAAVGAFRAQIETLLRERDGLPRDWQFPRSALLSLAEGFGFEGGYLVRGGARRAS